MPSWEITGEITQQPLAAERGTETETNENMSIEEIPNMDEFTSPLVVANGVRRTNQVGFFSENMPFIF